MRVDSFAWVADHASRQYTESRLLNKLVSNLLSFKVGMDTGTIKPALGLLPLIGVQLWQESYFIETNYGQPRAMSTSQ